MIIIVAQINEIYIVYYIVFIFITLKNNKVLKLYL